MRNANAPFKQSNRRAEAKSIFNTYHTNGNTHNTFGPKME